MELTQVQIDELEKYAKYNRMNIPSFLWDISKEQMDNHEKAYSQAESIKTSVEWQSEEYYELIRKSQHSAYIAIAFAAMFIEGAIFNFGSIYLGDKYMKDNLDKLSPLSKLQVVLKLVTGEELKSSGQAYEHFKILINYRNQLVHSKSKPLMASDDLINYQEKKNKDYERAINSAKKAVYLIDTETKQLHGDDAHPGIFGHGSL